MIELLVVIAIIGVLSSVVLASLRGARDKAKDAQRLSDMRTIRTALEMYMNDNNRYPDSDTDGCGGWDSGTASYPLLTGRNMEQYFSGPIPVDRNRTTSCTGYDYYRYSAGSYGCDASKGAYYVLGVRDMDSSGNPYLGSPGWSCPARDWQGEFDWVVGGFE